MPKTYKQLQNTWLTRIGDLWVQDEYDPTLFVNQKTQKVVSQREIDCSPDWFEEVPEKKVVERWRGSLYEKYYVMGHNRSSTSRTELDAHENSKNHANGDYFHCKKVSDRAITRVEIMCRLMGLAETIEEGSTEMNEDWTMGYYSVNNMEIIPVYSKSTSAYLNTSKLASFSTQELAQLFIDSAGQDAIDWYGAVK